MNEQDLERRLRSVTDGPQPYASPALRRFLHRLPDEEPMRGRRPRALLAAASGAFTVPRLAASGVVAAAIVLALVTGSFVVGLRGQVGPGAPTAIAPAASLSAPPSFMAAGVTWQGLSDYNGPVPTTAVEGGSDGYLGVGAGRLLTSRDGLRWMPVPAEKVALGDITYYSIARDEGGYALVGGATGTDGKPQARFFYSRDGTSWDAVSETADMLGAPARTVVSAGTSGYMAAGWNAGEDSLQPRIWSSKDGQTWTPMFGVPITGAAWLGAVKDTFLLSGHSVTGGHLTDRDIPVFMFDGTSWSMFQTSDATLQPSLAQVTAGVALPDSNALLLAELTDGRTALLTGDAASMGGVLSMTGTLDGTSVDSLGSIAITSPGTIVAASDDGSSLLASSDQGKTWHVVAPDQATLGPAGTKALQLGAAVLVTGKAGIWIGR